MTAPLAPAIQAPPALPDGPPPSLTILVPIYNERNTVLAALERIRGQAVHGLAWKEIVLIESNSTDGTRDLVLEFGRRHAEVRIILQDAPRGKSNAVLEGIAGSTGDIILIQDADLEYDPGDYQALLDPLLEGRCDFVLGSRNLGVRDRDQWRVREYGKGERLYATVLNIGGVVNHWIFNTLYGQKISDPTTMYKLFRRSLLAKVTLLEGKRFSLDWEIVCKFVRLGILPVEIPVSFSGRGKKAGKKIRIVKDGFNALKVIFKYWVCPLARIEKR